jgi:HD superfamily phosphodiesterase
MERHGFRVFRIMEKLAETHSLELDRELALCASLLFDLGAYPQVATARPYVDDSCDLARETLRPFDWDRERMQRLLDAVTYHHALRAQ